MKQTVNRLALCSALDECHMMKFSPKHVLHGLSPHLKNWKISHMCLIYLYSLEKLENPVKLCLHFPITNEQELSTVSFFLLHETHALHFYPVSTIPYYFTPVCLSHSLYFLKFCRHYYFSLLPESLPVEICRC